MKLRLNSKHFKPSEDQFAQFFLKFFFQEKDMDKTQPQNKVTGIVIMGEIL